MPLAGRQLSGAEVAELCYEAGWRRTKRLMTIVAIARAESGWYEKAWNPDDPSGGSYGLLQVNLIHGDKIEDLYDAQYNVRAAFKIYKRAGYRFTPWGAYTNRSYLKFLPLAIGQVTRFMVKRGLSPRV
jgi:hypothetical protein